jgi:class 3 adenylate cyclase/pimeloyl-ACP methyl ester carboxylesterase
VEGAALQGDGSPDPNFSAPDRLQRIANLDRTSAALQADGKIGARKERQPLPFSRNLGWLLRLGENAAVERPETHYALSGGVSIAYAVEGEGPVDLVFVHGYVSNIEVEAEGRAQRAFHERLAAFSRLIRFDRRGTGLSSRVHDVPTLEARMDDLRAVLDAVGSERAVLFGTFEAASMCMLFAATYPDRVLGLVLSNPIARGTWAPDYPWAMRAEQWREQSLEELARTWGTYEAAEGFTRTMAPTLVDDREFISFEARLQRASASPDEAITIREMAMDIDVREVLPLVHVPTLVLNMPAARAEADYVATRIPHARRLELTGPDFMTILLGDEEFGEVEHFVSSLRGETSDTVLATVLFTDIVGSTSKIAELGDRAWARLVAQHHALVRSRLDRYRGRELDTAGDGFFAAFDGPMRAVQCAREITQAVRDLQLDLRAGLHTGECERVGEKLAGMTVSVGARVAARAGPGEVLVTSIVKDLVAGSGIQFEDRGSPELKGIPGEWRLFAVQSA